MCAALNARTNIHGSLRHFDCSSSDPNSELRMRPYNDVAEMFKKDLEREQEKLRRYRDGKLRSMTLDEDRWRDSTVIAIEETKQRIAELKSRIAENPFRTLDGRILTAGVR